ncbi:fungal-specific transcription factor domain-containing protein [Pyrenochaeta sp. MPI-SDFR-AT-0127]|nr:fungal-specific transcription factor domain-containing protein [Pyrenochaeta sp. MPI-SDFR-AT-0127]
MSEKVTSENWQHYSTTTAKRKRADLVCFTCHAKKIKCDLQQQKNNGHDTCKNCFTVGKECHIRPSKRERRRKRSAEDGTVARFEQDADAIASSVDALMVGNATYQECTPSQIMQEPIVSASPRRSHHSSFSLQNPQPGNVRANVSTQSIFQAPSNSNDSPIAQRERIITGIAETTPTQNGDVDTGFLQVYAQENQFDAENQALVAQLEHRYCSDLRPDLEQIFTDTYFEFCYPWCPVLDRSTLASDIARSPLLANSLALASSHIQPPLLPHDGPEVYYKRARTIFYDDEESDEIMALQALCLFYWWAPQSPSRVHRHSSWWWTSVIIRHAQQMNIHREPSANDPSRERLKLGLRRRIWWTAFARERLTSLCQSKPVVIDPDDCNIQEPSLADFPSDAQSQHHGEIFVYWVRLCAIIGRIAKVLLKSNANSGSLQNELREELIAWVHSLPARLRLSINTARTENFDRDVHQLHLFYLTTIIILHLKRSGGQLPQALPPAIIAASCTARILRDILARGNSRFLMAITCWHVGTAFIALLQACRIPHLSKSANEDLDILSIAVKELQKMWASANVIAQGFERLRGPQPSTNADIDHVNLGGASHALSADISQPQDLSSLPNGGNSNADKDFDWMRFFPFVSKSTGGIAESLVSGRELGMATKGFPSPDNELFHGTLLAQYQDLFDPFTDYTFGFSDMIFDAT